MTPGPRRIAIGDDTPDDVRDRVLVLIDGDRMRDVVAYDVDEGWVMFVRHDDAGARIREGEYYTVCRQRGNVRAIMG